MAGRSTPQASATPAEAANNTTAPEPTLEQLQLAYRHMAHPGWPSTLEAALQVHHYRICIIGLARRLGRSQWQQQANRPRVGQPGAPVPPTPTEPRRTPRQRQEEAMAAGRADMRQLMFWPHDSRYRPGGPDRKPLAANNRED